MSDKYIVSASILPSAHDCMRRSASKAFGARKRSESKFGILVEEAGYSFEKMKSSGSYASALGTGIHKVIEHHLEFGVKSESIDAGISSLLENAEGAEGDSKTPTISHAENQLMMIGNYVIDNILPPLDIVFCEKGITAELNNFVDLEGHIDLGINVSEKLQIKDWKFGANGSGYSAQMGAYSLLAKSAGFDVSSDHIIDHLPRLKTKVTHTPITIDTFSAENLAHSTGKHISRAIKDFEKTGDPDVFIANPSSSLCSSKYCPAYGTEFCNAVGEK